MTKMPRGHGVRNPAAISRPRDVLHVAPAAGLSSWARGGPLGRPDARSRLLASSALAGGTLRGFVLAAAVTTGVSLAARHAAAADYAAGGGVNNPVSGNATAVGDNAQTTGSNASAFGSSSNANG